MNNSKRVSAAGLIALVGLIQLHQLSDNVEVARIAIEAALSRRGPMPAFELNPNAVASGMSSPNLKGLGPLKVPVEAISQRMGSRTRVPDSAVLGGRVSLPYVSISEPTIIGDTAKVTVVSIYPTHRARPASAYETVEFILTRRGTGWLIAKMTQLGVS